MVKYLSIQGGDFYSVPTTYLTTTTDLRCYAIVLKGKIVVDLVVESD